MSKLFIRAKAGKPGKAIQAPIAHPWDVVFELEIKARFKTWALLDIQNGSVLPPQMTSGRELLEQVKYACFRSGTFDAEK